MPRLHPRLRKQKGLLADRSNNHEEESEYEYDRSSGRVADYFSDDNGKLLLFYPSIAEKRLELSPSWLGECKESEWFRSRKLQVLTTI